MKRKSRPQHNVPGFAQGKTRSPVTSAQAMAKLPIPEGREAVAAGIALSPEFAAGLSVELMIGKQLQEAGIDSATVTQALNAEGQTVTGGDLDHLRRTLTAQVATLDRMFHHLFQLAHVAGKSSHVLFERYLRLALRAQNQAMRTTNVLGRLCPEPRRSLPAKVEPQEANQPPTKAAAEISPVSAVPDAGQKSALAQDTPIPKVIEPDKPHDINDSRPFRRSGRDNVNGLNAPRR